MAKQTKSGLGRGLSTLIGGSFEESAPRKPLTEEKPEPPKKAEPPKAETALQPKAAPARQRITIEPGEIPEYDPILEPSTMRSTPIPSKGMAAQKPPVRQEASEPTEQPTPTNTTNSQTAQTQDQDAPVSASSEKDASSQKEKSTQPAADVDQVVMIAIDELEPNPNQPRTNFDKNELEELATSIEREGLLQPILVRRRSNGTYQIVAGERRWQASKIAGLKEVPIILKDVNEDKAIELALIENLQRSDLNPIEEAYGYRRLMDRKRWTQAQLAYAMSKGRSTIANALRLLDLPEDAQQLLFEEKITAGHARAILSVPSAEGREKLTEKLKNEKLSVREAENIARLMSYHEKDTKAPSRPTIPDAYKRVAKALRDVLNTTVRVRSSKGKNRIEIDFADEAELDRIFEGLLTAKDEA